MDLTPLYDLRERLKAGAIAGTELVSEDFRLKRAVEAFAPLESASPVFSKVGQLARAAAAPECEDRAGALLDALTLTDAVLCTQGAVAVQGETEPLPDVNWGIAVTNAPYSVLSVLLDSLTTSGGGRYSFVVETHENQPELFRDYRVKEAMVRALGASYAELAEEVAKWLKQDGPEILPLLQNGFDPAGKKDMVRRVEVMEAVAGAQANFFYLAQLENAQKDVRGALIYALRHSEDNAEILLKLVKTERGNQKKMVYWALSQLNGEKVWDFWEKFAVKNPGEAAKYMLMADSPQASRLVAGSFKKLLQSFREQEEPAKLTPDIADAIEQLLKVLPAKTGPEICECYRLAAALGGTLDRPVEGKKEKWTPGLPVHSPFDRMETFSQAIPVILRYSLLLKPDPELEKLAEELYQTYGVEYLPAALTAGFLTKPSAECYEQVENLLERKTLLGVKTDKKKLEYVYCGLVALNWNEKAGAVVLEAMRFGPFGYDYNRYVQSLAEPLDERFYDLLIRCTDEKMVSVLVRLIQPENRSLCMKIGKYFYDRALKMADSRKYLDYLRKCGYPECADLAVRYCRKSGRISVWECISFLDRMPGDNTARADEAQRVLELLEKEEVKLRGGDISRLRDYILELRNREATA